MTQNGVHPQFETFLQALHGEGPPIQQEMEALAAQREFPIVGPLVGRLLSVLARSVGAQSVFEMGSGFGYSTYFFAAAVGDAGRVVHTDSDPKNAQVAKDFLQRAGVLGRVDFMAGDAMTSLQQAPGPFDIIFCDIEKEDYPRVVPLAVGKLRAGGLLIFDNVFWSGRVMQTPGEDAATRGVQETLQLLFARQDLQTTVVPLRDGVSVSLKLSAGP